MKTRYYLAYGSNLSVEQMAFRCPDAKIVGKAILADWRLVFKTHADIIPAKGWVVPVLVWEISNADEKSLDRYEGFPRYYVKKEFDIIMTDLKGDTPQNITAMAYVMNEGFSMKTPSWGYYQTLKDGYRNFGFNEHFLKLALSETLEGGQGIVESLRS